MLRPPHEHAPGAVATLSAADTISLLAVWAVAGLVLGFWLVPSMTIIAPSGWAEMSSLTAEGLLLAVGSLTLTTRNTSRVAELAATAAAAAVALIGLLTLFAGVDVIQLATSPLPSEQTAAAFVLLGATLLLMRVRRLPPLVAEISATIFAAFLLFMIGGHIFNAASLVTMTDGRLISLQTLICMVLLASVIAGRLALAGGGLFEMMVEKGLGSRILRAMTPVILVVPFVLFAFVAFFYETDILSANVTRALFAPAVVIAVFALVGWMAHRINRLQTELTRQSITDELTGVFNRRGFSSVADYLVRAAERTGTNLAVLFFDVDGLKEVNDTLGHDAGSDMLKRFAGLLTATFHKNDLIARIGGDEFVVLAALGADEISAVLERINQGVAVANASNAVRIAFSVGFAPLARDSDNALNDAMTVADGYMYQQKRNKKQVPETQAHGRHHGLPEPASGQFGEHI